MNHLRAYWVTCIVALIAAAASATTIILPTDAQLITKSPVIVSGTVVRSNPVAIGDAIWTETILSVDRTFKSDVSGDITIREIGGILGDRITKVSARPSTRQASA